MGIEPRFREYVGECCDPVGYVFTKNLARRQLDTSRAAMAVAKGQAMRMATAAALERMRDGGRKGGKMGGRPRKDGSPKEAVPAEEKAPEKGQVLVPDPFPGGRRQARDDLAKMAKCCPSTISHAARILRDAPLARACTPAGGTAIPSRDRPAGDGVERRRRVRWG